ncbi:hypothetical protein [Pedobacter sp. UC225_65]|uniref:hypothetical protein n=1 Tax=Pedobacter sp. UC225_65 TaxID=3350173 RepID=UPI0036716114
MKKLTIFSLLLSLAFAVNAQDKKPNPNYDAALAKQYEADDYGMKMYVLVDLKNREQYQ